MCTIKLCLRLSVTNKICWCVAVCRLYSTTNKCRSLLHLWNADNTRQSSSHRAKNQTLAEKCNFCLLHLHSMPPLGGSLSEYFHNFWYAKTRMVWLPDSEKFWRYDYSFWHDIRTCQTARQTDKHTSHDGVGCIIHSTVRQKCNVNEIRNNFQQIRVTIVTEVQWRYVWNNRQAVFQNLAARRAKRISTEIYLNVSGCYVWRDTHQYVPVKPQTTTDLTRFTGWLKLKYPTRQNAISQQPCEIFIPKFFGIYGRDPATILKLKRIILVVSKVMAV